MKKQAFTLVELIVVITILAILSTISFITLSGYSKEARDAKRISDTRNLLTKINIKQTKGIHLGELIKDTSTVNLKILANDNPNVQTFGKAHFDNLKEDSNNFKDPSDKTIDYPLAYAIGGTGSGAYKFFQAATISEKENKTILMGNYFQLETDDSKSLFLTGASSYTEPSAQIYEEGGKKIYDEGSGIKDSGSSSGGSTPTNQLCNATTNDGFALPETEHNSIALGIKNGDIATIPNSTQIILKREYKCNNGTFEYLQDLGQELTCQTNYVENAGACVANSCSGSIPANAIQNGTQAFGTSWSYSDTEGVCKFKCDINYSWNNSNKECIISYTGSAGATTTNLPTIGLGCTANDILIKFGDGTGLTMAGCNSKGIGTPSYSQCSNINNCQGDYYKWINAQSACSAPRRLPTKAELDKMISNLGLDTKSILGSPYNGKLTGMDGGTFSGMYGYIQSNTQKDSNYGYLLFYFSNGAFVSDADKTLSYPVRCFKN